MHAKYRLPRRPAEPPVSWRATAALAAWMGVLAGLAAAGLSGRLADVWIIGGLGAVAAAVSSLRPAPLRRHTAVRRGPP